MVWLCIGWNVLGIILGIFIAMVIKNKKANAHFAGTIRLDRSDPDSPYLFLELSQDGMNKIMHTDYVLLHVNLQNYISQ